MGEYVAAICPKSFCYSVLELMNERLLFAKYVVCTCSFVQTQHDSVSWGYCRAMVILFFSYDSKSQTLVERNSISRRINRCFNGRMEGGGVVEKFFS